MTCFSRLALSGVRASIKSAIAIRLWPSDQPVRQPAFLRHQPIVGNRIVEYTGDTNINAVQYRQRHDYPQQTDQNRNGTLWRRNSRWSRRRRGGSP